MQRSSFNHSKSVIWASCGVNKEFLSNKEESLVCRFPLSSTNPSGTLVQIKGNIILIIPTSSKHDSI